MKNLRNLALSLLKRVSQRVVVSFKIGSSAVVVVVVAVESVWYNF